MVTFETVGGAVCLDFVNTGARRREGPFREQLEAYDDLVAWSEAVGQLQPAEAADLVRRAGAAQEEAAGVLARAKELREAVYRVFSARFRGEEIAAADLRLISDEYAAATAHRELVPAPDGRLDFEWRDPQRLERPLWPIAVSAAVLAASDEVDRVKECATDNCNWLFLDASRNRSRRWCEMKECGNRAKAKKHYERRKKKGVTEKRERTSS